MNEIERAISEIIGTNYGECKCHRETMVQAAEALREKQTRESGCEYCMGPKMNYSPVNEMFFDVDEIVAQVTMTAKILFCPMCGKRLEEHHDAD